MLKKKVRLFALSHSFAPAEGRLVFFPSWTECLMLAGNTHRWLISLKKTAHYSAPPAAKQIPANPASPRPLSSLNTPPFSFT